MSTGETTRRGALGAGLAAGATAVLGTTEAEAAKRRKRATGRKKRTVDVCVVGAGLAGLMAARELVAAGRTVVVLEARDRVGGRTLNRALGPRHPGEVVEVGGQWVGPTQDVLLELAEELGVETFKTYNSGSYLYHRSGQSTPYSSTGPFGAIPPDASGAAEAFAAIAKLDEMAATLPIDRPWTAPNALEWDGQTFETWKLANAQTASGRFLLDLTIEAIWACEPRDVSLLHVLLYIRGAGNEQTGGSLNRLINTAGGAQESRFVGGSQRLSLEMAQRLGRRVVLSSPVRRIDQTGRRAVVTSDRYVVTARQVVVAVPPVVSGAIEHLPPLPAQRAQLVQRFPAGNAIKCIAVYPTPFWRDAGLAGQVTSDAEAVRITFDNSPPDGSPGVMLAFLEGHAARFFGRKTEGERRAAVLKDLVTYFGPKAATPEDYFEMDWADETWTRGCYVGFTPPGVLLDFGEAIREPCGRVHWAGAEAATVWNGYMEGAVRSGARAAKDVLRALS